MRQTAVGPVERWRGWVLAAVFALTLPVGYAGPLGFVPLAAAAGVLLLPAARFKGGDLRLILPLAALVAWAAVTLVWSPAAPNVSAIDDYEALEGVTAVKLALQAVIFTALLLASNRLGEPGARTACAVLVFTVATLTLVSLAEGLTGAGFYRWIRISLSDPIRSDLAMKNVAQATYVAALLVWPAGLALARARPGAAALAGGAGLLIAVAALMFGAFAPAAALAASLAAFGLVSAAPRVGPLVCAASAVTVSLAAPFVLTHLRLPVGVPASWTARADIWRFASERALERPFTGWGLDASRTFGGAVPLHPHNAPLQMWLELGLPGAILFALFWGSVFWFAGCTAEDDPPMGGMWAATATVYFTIGSLSFGVWQEWWLALGAIAFAAALAVRRAWPRAFVGELQSLA